MSLTAAQIGKSNSTKAFLTALVANGGLLVVEVAAFVVLKNRLGRIYSPRTYLPPPAKRAHELPVSWWRWVPALLVESPKEIIDKNGLDAYMVLRYLKMLIWIFLVFTVSTFLVIIPVDIVGIPSSQTTDPIQRVTWTNIPGTKQAQKRLSAHLIMIYCLTFFVLFMIRREMLHFVDVRHKFLISKSHSRLAQARTVLIVNVPAELANEHDLRLFASFVPGGIDRVWIYRDTKKLNKLFQRRQDACTKLEAAEAEVLKHATNAWRIKELAHRKMQKNKKRDEEQGDTPLELPAAPSREFLDELVPEDDRPTHRIGFLGLLGEKVETIPWCTDEISKLNHNISVKGKFLGSVFIRCNLQLGAHVLAQCVSHHQPLKMMDKWMETSPKDIVWENLDDGALEMTGRYVTSWIATIGLIIAWGFPVAFIGTLSQIQTLCQQAQHIFPHVSPAPNPIPGIIQGILPPVLLAILFALLPPVLRLLAWYECIPRYSVMSISVYRLVHQIIKNPTSTVQNLAKELPGVSVFFLTYMALAQLFPIVIHFVRKWFLGRTPRQAYSVTFLMPSADFGLVLPRLSLLATIGFAYSVLNPVINIFALLSYIMFYLAFKFLLTQVYDQPDESETGGMYFPISISNLFVGLYIAQASVSPASAVAEGVLMILLIVITAMAQIMINRSFAPITNFLPMSLATKKMAKRYERHQQKHGGPVTPNEELNLDLFNRHALQSVRRRVTRLPRQLDRTLLTLKEKVKEEGERLSTSKSVREKLLQEQQREAQAQAEQDEAVMADLKNGDAPELYDKSSPTSKKSKKAVARKSDSGQPQVDPAASAGVDISDEDVSSDEEEEQDDHAFDHPSTYVEQPWIWVPKDRLGLSKLLVADLHESGVDASDLGAIMDHKGIVEVTRNPPDAEWYGGNDL
ncbi:late exocytosis, associated with Golgi transport-domain-containing protein [Mycena haematopus]|nr:late exocytosis, associated with Golgi transport-domain-containing protein [Mycena haematopus]